MYSKSQKTGITGMSGDESVNLDMEGETDNMTNLTKGIAADPIIMGLNSLFEGIQEEIDMKSQDKMALLERMRRNQQRGMHDGEGEDDNKLNDEDFNFR